MSVRKIIRIEYCRLSQLAGLTVVCNREAILPSAASFTEVHLTKPAEMEVTDEQDGGRRLFTTRLRFTTCKPMEGVGRTALRLTDTRGLSYLVGTQTRPWPTVSATDRRPASPGEPDIWDYEVTWQTLHGPLTIL